MRRLFYNGRVLAEEGPFARGYVVTAGRTILDVGEGVYSGQTTELTHSRREGGVRPVGCVEARSGGTLRRLGPTGTPETLDERCRRQFR